MKILVAIFLGSLLLLPSIEGKTQQSNNKNKKISAEYISPIKSIEYNSLIKDLKFLGPLLNDKKIVVLGENFHEDGTVLKLKSRITKYLIDSLGFEVLFYELPYEDVNRVNYLSKTADEFLICLETIFFEPSENTINLHKELSLFNPKKISIEGIDLGMERTCIGSIRYYDSVFTRYNNPEFYKLWYDYSFSYYDGLGSNIDIKKLSVMNKAVKAKLPELALSDSVYKRTVLMLDNLYYQMADLTDKRTNNYKGLTIDLEDQVRDSCMFQNFDYLYENFYKGKKVIIWTANYHGSRNISTIQKEKRVRTFGDYLFKKYENAYSFANISYEGVIGRLHPGAKNDYNIVNNPDFGFKIPKHKENSYETMLKDSYTGNCFFNLKKFEEKNKPEARWMMSLSNEAEKTDEWSSVFDGIFYINTSTLNQYQKINFYLKQYSSNEIARIENIYQFGCLKTGHYPCMEKPRGEGNLPSGYFNLSKKKRKRD